MLRFGTAGRERLRRPYQFGCEGAAFLPRMPASPPSPTVAARGRAPPPQTSPLTSPGLEGRVPERKGALFLLRQRARLRQFTLPLPPPSGPALLPDPPPPGGQPLPGDHLSPHSLGSCILRKPRGESSLPLHVRVLFATLPSPLPERQQPPGAHLSPPFRPLTQSLQSPPALGSVLPAPSTCEPRAVNPPFPGPAPQGRAPPTSPRARAQGTWPPLPRLRSLTRPRPARPAPRPPSPLPPPPLPIREAGPERARRRVQWALVLLWPLPRAAANRGGRWW